jgi:hypothetical protein
VDGLWITLPDSGGLARPPLSVIQNSSRSYPEVIHTK